jgi:AraC family transcriptional regulator, arabinose operon regulatory protein
MAKNINRITETLIIPKGSEEKFINPVYNNGHIIHRYGFFIFGISTLKPGYRVIRPKGRDHVFIYCTSGKGDIIYDNQTHSFSKGDCILVKANAIQNYGSDQSFSMLWTHINPEHKNVRFVKPEFRVWPAHNNQLENLYNLLYTETHTINALNIKIVETSIELIIAWLQREFSTKEQAHTIRLRRKLDNLWFKISNDLSYPWDIKTMSKIVHMSCPHFHALSQQLYNKSPMGMVTKLRITKAQALLQNSNLKLNSIANMVGYTSGFSLSRTFKKHTGYSPSTLRANKH